MTGCDWMRRLNSAAIIKGCSVWWVGGCHHYKFVTSGVPDTSESLGHFAESTLLSHDIVSDDFSWSSSNLITRLYFLVGIRHRHRWERAFSQDTKEALNSSCICKVLRIAHSNHFLRRSLQIGPQTSHCTFLFTRFQASSKPQRCRFIFSKSQNISIPDWHTIDMSQAILRLH